MIILSHPVFAQTGLLWDLYNTDFWSEEYARNIQLCHTVLWELMNEYGILPHEKRLFDISEADEWLSWIRECLSKAESTEQKECLARLFNLYLPPEPYDKMTREEQTKFALVDYIFGLFINDQLWQEALRACGRLWRAWKEESPFWGTISGYRVLPTALKYGRCHNEPASALESEWRQYRIRQNRAARERLWHCLGSEASAATIRAPSACSQISKGSSQAFAFAECCTPKPLAPPNSANWSIPSGRRYPLDRWVVWVGGGLPGVCAFRQSPETAPLAAGGGV